MAITPIDTISNSIDEQADSQRNVIDKNEFLMLLVTQLQNQDPLNPMEYSEFTSQTAQFASLEQLQNVNENLGYLQKYQSALFDEHAVSFIGKTIKVSDNTVDINEGASKELQFELGRDAAEVYVSVYASNGEFVKEISETGSFSAGEQGVTWDGTDDNGNPVPDGRYSFEVQAVDANGNTFAGAPFFESTVTSVNFWDGTAYLTAGNHEIAMGNVIKVSGS